MRSLYGILNMVGRPQYKMLIEQLAFSGLNIPSHENKKTLSPFYHIKYFWKEMNERHPMGALHSFSIKNIFND